jgi:hypothetical protein
MRAELKWIIAAGAVFIGLTGFQLPSRSFGDPASESDELAIRNRAFLYAVAVSNIDSLLPFFPRTGEFAYTFTFRHPHGDSVGVWRFPAADARRAIEGPLRLSFSSQDGMVGMGSLLSATTGINRAWRRVAHHRFVPPGSQDSSPTYVQWRREGLRWVVAALGDEGMEEGMEPSWSPEHVRDHGAAN